MFYLRSFIKQMWALDQIMSVVPCNSDLPISNLFKFYICFTTMIRFWLESLTIQWGFISEYVYKKQVNGATLEKDRQLLRHTTKNKIVHLRILEKFKKSNAYFSDMLPFLIPMIFSLLSVFYSISSFSSPFLIFYTTVKLKQLDMKHGLPYLLCAYYGCHILIY